MNERSAQTRTLSYPFSRVSYFAIGLAVSVVLPVITHLFAGGGDIPLGARLLPMFYAPYILAVRRGHVEAVGVAVLAPYLNALLTARPAHGNVLSLSIEIAIFAMISRFLSLRSGGSAYSGPLAVISSVFVMTAVMGERLVFLSSPDRAGAFFETTMLAAPGMGMILLLDCLIKTGRKAA